MLQSTQSQRIRHDLVTEQQQRFSVFHTEPHSEESYGARPLCARQGTDTGVCTLTALLPINRNCTASSRRNQLFNMRRGILG